MRFTTKLNERARHNVPRIKYNKFVNDTTILLCEEKNQVGNFSYLGRHRLPMHCVFPYKYAIVSLNQEAMDALSLKRTAISGVS